MYLMLVIAFSLLALLPALPLSAYLAWVVAAAMGVQFNYDPLGFRPVPAALLIQVAVGLGVPLLAGFLPVITGSRITIHDASAPTVLEGHGRGLIDRLVENIRGLSRPLLISLRNTVRRKGRLVLTLTTLALGGAIFISVFNLRVSMVVFIDQISKYFMADVNVDFQQLYRLDEIEKYVMQIPGVKRWRAGRTGGELLRADGTGVDNVSIIAPPADSELVEPVLLQGRWLLPGDQNAIALNNAFWKTYPDLKVATRSSSNQR
jgi:putative ABC transport system permease protein